MKRAEENVYERLARRLDSLPNGFPATESGVELRLLARLFDPEEAETALLLEPRPRTADAVAERIGRPLDETQALLDRMARKGLIGCHRLGGRRTYMLAPFLIGIYEFQVDRLDEDFARLFAEYRETLLKTVGGAPPALTRVVPAGVSIEARHEVLRYEDLRAMIEEARSFALRECICRKQKALEGKPCTHPLETCLGFTPEENAFDDFNYAGRIITREEALDVLDMTEKEGLVHCTYNIEKGHRFVCSCCDCCCELIMALKDRSAPYLLAGSHFVAAIDGETCSACGTCAEERCMMDAVIGEKGAYRVIEERCIGCGVCVPSCPTGSIALERREDSAADAPPASLAAWAGERMKNRFRE